jgi:hypothetical protein
MNKQEGNSMNTIADLTKKVDKQTGMIDFLKDVRQDIKYECIDRADIKINLIYELFTAGQINLTEDEENFMYVLIDEISTAKYGN